LSLYDTIELKFIFSLERVKNIFFKGGLKESAFKIP